MSRGHAEAREIQLVTHPCASAGPQAAFSAHTVRASLLSAETPSELADGIADGTSRRRVVAMAESAYAVFERELWAHPRKVRYSIPGKTIGGCWRAPRP